MDSFGRLPTDVIQLITNMVQSPTIDITTTSYECYMVITYPNMCLKIDMITDKYQSYDSNLKNVCNFIKQLKNNIECKYETYNDVAYFSIEVNDKINIRYNGTPLELKMDNKEILICAMEKYYNSIKK